MMDGRDFLSVADTLMAGQSEAEWRSAVSRAYYAAFHVARQFLLRCEFQAPTSDRAHAYLWLRLSNCGSPNLSQAGERLNALRGSRNAADYDLERTIQRNEALAQVLAAKKVIEVLDASSDPDKKQITESIKAYERDVLKEATWRA